MVADPMTTAEAARELGVKQGTVRAQFARGRLTGRRTDRVILLDRDSVYRYRREFLGRPGRRKEGTPS